MSNTEKLKIIRVIQETEAIPEEVSSDTISFRMGLRVGTQRFIPRDVLESARDVNDVKRETEDYLRRELAHYLFDDLRKELFEIMKMVDQTHSLLYGSLKHNPELALIQMKEHSEKIIDRLAKLEKMTHP